MKQSNNYGGWSLQEIICCPECKGDLVLGSQHCICSGCDNSYPLVGGVPLLISGVDAASVYPSGDDVSAHPYGQGSLDLIEEYSDGLVLDLGAGGKATSFPNVVQLDIFRFPKTNVIGQAESLPFKDGVFDAVVSQAVFEHLRSPEIAAQEIFRVCKPGAKVKIDTAFLQPLHGYPDHYFNATSSGLRLWFGEFEIVWEGIEPYQHPRFALDWMLRVYLDGMSRGDAELFKSATVGEVIDAVSGQSTSGGEMLSSILGRISPQTENAIASGVSLLATKPTSKAVPAKTGYHMGSGMHGANVVALEKKITELEWLLREKNALLVIKNEVEDVLDREFTAKPSRWWESAMKRVVRRMVNKIKVRIASDVK